MAGEYLALLVIVAAAVLCPLVSSIIPKKLVPETVLLLLAGAVLGPNMAGVIQENDVIRFLSQLGLAFQFLLAGYEIDPALLRGKKGRKGLATWLLSFALALAAAWIVMGSGGYGGDNSDGGYGGGNNNGNVNGDGGAHGGGTNNDGNGYGGDANNDGGGYGGDNSDGGYGGGNSNGNVYGGGDGRAHGGNSQFALLALAITMTSTAFGTVLSILKERKLLATPLGESTLTYGVWGQLGPVVAIALLLSSRQPWQTLLLLVGLVVLSAAIAAIARKVKKGRSKLKKTIKSKGRASTQMFVRMAILLLIALVAFSSAFGLNIMLGAFAAGFVMRHVLPKGHKRTEAKLHGIGYGFFIPIFFVESGTKIDLVAIGLNPLMLVMFAGMLVLVRALPVFVAQSVGGSHRLERRRDRAAVAAYCTTALSIIVVVTTIAVDAGVFAQETASVMVAAAAVSVLVMPVAAQLLHGKSGSSPACSRGND